MVTRAAIIAAGVALAMPAKTALGYRPFVSTDAAVADVGDVEIELGYAGFRNDHHETTFVAPAVVGNLGVVRGVELVGEFSVANDLTRRDADSPRIEDPAVSAKWVVREGVLQDQGTTPSLAVELSALLPTQRREQWPGGEIIGLLSGRTLGWTYHLNAGPVFDGARNEPGVEWGVILEHALHGPLRAVFEINGEGVRSRAADDSALLGAIWDIPAPAPLHDLSFDVGVRRGISRAADDWGGTAGLTFAFPWRTP